MERYGIQVAPTGEKNQKNSLFESNTEKMLLDAVPEFRPTASDLDDLRSHRSIGRKLVDDGITKEDLSVVAQTTTDHRRKETANYLSRHFEDVANLTSGESRNIDSEDYALYKDMLVQRSLRPYEVNIRGWERLHYAREMQKQTPASSTGHLVVTITGITGSIAAFQLLNVKFTPLTVAASVLGVAVSQTGGTLIGQAIEGRREKIALHFVDEAAPAMRRLMQSERE